MSDPLDEFKSAVCPACERPDGLQLEGSLIYCEICDWEEILKPDPDGVRRWRP